MLITELQRTYLCNRKHTQTLSSSITLATYYTDCEVAAQYSSNTNVFVLLRIYSILMRLQSRVPLCIGFVRVAKIE